MAALATASGFLAFTPTAFVGVAQLGMIAGGGMLIAFLCTLTLLPALLVQFRPRREKSEVGVMLLRRLEPVVRPLHWPILVVFGLLALAGAALTPSIPFDGDPLHTKNQHTEAVTTLHDLMADPLTNPYTIDALLPSLRGRRRHGHRLAKLPTRADGADAGQLRAAGPDGQAAAHRGCRRHAAPTLTPAGAVPPPDAADLRRPPRAGRPAARRAGQAGRRTTRCAPSPATWTGCAPPPDATLLAANDALTASCRCSSTGCARRWPPGPSRWPTCPPTCARDWLLPDGRARVQVLPQPGGERQRVAAPFRGRGAAGDAGGQRVGRGHRRERPHHRRRLPHRGASALVAIAVILVVALRRVLDVLLVMAPLMSPRC